MKYIPPLNALPGDEEDDNRSHWNADPSGENLPLRQGAFPDAVGFEAVQREILNAITAGGLTPDGEDYTQLAQAIAAAVAGIDISGLIHEDDVLAVSPAGAFGGQLLHIQDQKPSGTAGGSFTSGAWRTRDMNVVITNEIPGASLSSNQVTLPAGEHYLKGRAPAYRANDHKIRVQDVDNDTTLLVGTSAFSQSGAVFSQDNSFVSGRFTLVEPTTIELQHICNSSQSGNGFGNEGSFGVSEVYAELKIWKVG
ncbi:MAG: hypothetical protein QGH69_05240 [Alphaproteobacteria bacterium]|jgi:hypothetical protein|nr:hypothetical protein [Alphaproteobacteria bacterium]